MKLIFRYMSD